MDTIPILLLLAGILLGAILLSRTDRGKKLGAWLWVGVLLAAFGAAELLRAFRGAKPATPESKIPTETSPSLMPDKPNIPQRAELTKRVAEAETKQVKPVSSVEEFRQRLEEDGL